MELVAVDIGGAERPQPTDPESGARQSFVGAHADLALADIDDICALMRASKSWVHDEIRHGRFPRPVIQQPRFTRWRAADVRAALQARIEQGLADTDAGAALSARAKAASDAAKAKREAS